MRVVLLVALFLSFSGATDILVDDGGGHVEGLNLDAAGASAAAVVDTVDSQDDDDATEWEEDVDPEDDRNGSFSSAPASIKRLWGAAPTAASEAASSAQKNLSAAPDAPGVVASSSEDASPHLSSSAFIPKPKPATRAPPEGFVISARVYIDPDDKLAHLDEDPITLPYWDCGVTGSTTSPLPVMDAAFRHSLNPTTPWTGTDGKHPLLAIALSPLLIETNSGESQSIKAGQVILLEDVLMAGHKLLPLHNQELQVLFLTLPQTHYHPGKDRVSLHDVTSSKSSVHPCPVQAKGAARRTRRRPLLTPHNVQRFFLGMIGLSLSTLAADFFSKTAPLWLAVGVGGTCFVTAGTAATVMAGEMALTNLEVWFEQRKLAMSKMETLATATQHHGVADDDDEAP